MTNLRPGLRVSAELVALADALVELADETGHHAVARHASRVAGRFAEQVLAPPARQRQLAGRTALELLRPLAFPALRPDLHPGAVPLMALNEAPHSC